jgi:hypothetical protein
MAKKKKTKEPNPNGANQYQLDPRQKLCWDLYINPKSETFSNALQSAIQAGYEPEYANQITTAEWFLGKLRRLNLLGKSEIVLEEMLDLPVHVIKYQPRSRFGDDEEGEDEDEEPQSYLATEPQLIKIKQDTAKFLAERLGKNEGYSTRSEITGAGGESLIPDKQSQEKADEAIETFLTGGKKK